MSKTVRARADAAKKADAAKAGASGPPRAPPVHPAPRPRTPRTPFPTLPTPGGGGAEGMAKRTGALVAKFTCTICKTQLMGNAPKSQLESHVDSKHPKEAFAVVFPEWEDKE